MIDTRRFCLFLPVLGAGILAGAVVLSSLPNPSRRDAPGPVAPRVRPTPATDEVPLESAPKAAAAAHHAPRVEVPARCEPEGRISPCPTAGASPSRIPADGADRPALAALMQLDPAALRAVLRDVTDPETAWAAAWTIGNRLQPSNEDVAVVLERLTRSQPGEVDLRRTLWWVLSQRPDQVPLELAIDWSSHQDAADVRRGALRALVGVYDPRATEAIVAVAHGDPDRRNRLEGVTFLTVRLDAEEAMRQAMTAMRGERDPEVRARWLNLVGVQSVPAAADVLRQALYSAQEPAAAREMAAHMLAERDPVAARMLAADPAVPEEIRRQVQARFLESVGRVADRLPGSDR